MKRKQNNLPQRVDSVDILRGITIVLMALDHVRDFWSMTSFSPTDLGQSTPAYFFTRWVTHFCAPTFIFLSGASAWLYQRNHCCSTRRLSVFLQTRGLWLIIVEITLITYAWQFHMRAITFQVIWAIGASMIALGFLVLLSRIWITAFGLTLVLFHNSLDFIQPEPFAGCEWLWTIMHVNRFLPLSWMHPMQGIQVVYPLIPWIGVMALGYAFGPILELRASTRRAMLFGIGMGSILAFIVLRYWNLYGDPGIDSADAPWNNHGRGPLYAIMSFLNTTKYPPSLLYLLMTLGPVFAMLPALEYRQGKIAQWLRIFGQVPFFFYILHLYVIHLGANLWFGLHFDIWNIEPFDSSTWPVNFHPVLWRAYLVWILLILFLYWPCRWFVRIRRTYPYRWLSYF